MIDFLTKPNHTAKVLLFSDFAKLAESMCQAAALSESQIMGAQRSKAICGTDAHPEEDRLAQAKCRLYSGFYKGAGTSQRVINF